MSSDSHSTSASTDTTNHDIPPEYQREEYIEDRKSIPRQLLDGLRGEKIRLLSAIIVVLILGTAVFAPYLAPYDPDQRYELLQPPNSYSEGDFDRDGVQEQTYHFLGTNSFGEDVFSKVIMGTRISLLVAVITVTAAFLVGTIIGLLAGFYRGWVDTVLMRYIDFQWAFPELVLAIAIIAFVGRVGVINVIIAISLAYVDDFARLVRGEVLWIREEEYIKAARTIGMSNRRIMLREILPNAVAPIIVQATVMIPLAILAEAGLSFLGLGVKPTTPTWGLLINGGRGYITTAWWIAVMPGIAIMITALSFNILGDSLRDIFDITEMEEGR
jgi:peptide/nickel transport system permease protein